MTSPSLTLRIRRQRAEQAERRMLELVIELEDAAWRHVYAPALRLSGARRARVMVWGLLAGSAAALLVSALRGCM